MFELPWAFMEAARVMLAWGPLLQAAPKGDGHPVMVLPGFMGGDESTLVLRRFLTRLGYVALPWLQGQNIGRPELLENATLRFYRMHRVYDTKISLIGQSLGGVFARDIAREFPDKVRSVITLGSPFAAQGDDVATPGVKRLFELMSGLTIEEMRAMEANDARVPLGIPSTAIYSRVDGVVAWDACLERDTELAENVEVVGSHSGMALNPDVLHIIADRLAQEPSTWRKFDRRKGCRGWIYPPPATAPRDIDARAQEVS